MLEILWELAPRQVHPPPIARPMPFFMSMIGPSISRVFPCQLRGRYLLAGLKGGKCNSMGNVLRKIRWLHHGNSDNMVHIYLSY